MLYATTWGSYVASPLKEMIAYFIEKRPWVKLQAIARSLSDSSIVFPKKEVI
jgi:hypothetical protein